MGSPNSNQKFFGKGFGEKLFFKKVFPENEKG